ncbi:right-handed parallel beta-helix repeat-containing protein [Thetidibacter halocola]|uniref:Right-handed parallel beta-helix repeat-containing protein n=1 Tax=Thetidibacter halocola TaxID=2827239 RepID=A0A8J7WDJ5_9RHOB|nr:right-handed parallel beta-helix repeat-containing protein [Thetidibacter halocola]MBS0123413.1 right-handed parallel beta-helix repeat-containing protein [Thetidibacter halocola]
MPDGLAHRLSAILGVAGLCAALLGPVPARADTGIDLHDLRARMTALTDTLRNDPTARDRSVVALLDQAGLPRPAPVEAAAAPSALSALPDGPAQSSLQNMRLALAILAQSHGGKDNTDILLAQGPRGTDALAFRGGSVTLSDIAAALARHGLPPMVMDGTGTWVLRAPVLLWEDTTLRLGPLDRIALSRPDGAFLMSFGRVSVEGAWLGVSGGENALAPDFVPFLAVGGGGMLTMRGARVQGLGFGQTGKFSGVAVAAHPVMRALGRSRIEDTLFEDVMTVSITGATGAEVLSNRFFDMRHNALLVSASPMAQVAGNLFFGDAVTNAIRVLNGSSDTRVSGNYVLEGDRAAIIVEGNSARVAVTGNVLSNRIGGGIKLFRTRCGVVSGNVVLDMRQKGIEVRQSRDTTVSANLVAGSRNAGIWVSAQSRGAVTQLSDNVLIQNASGISTATGETLLLEGNDLSQQFPRLLDGDVAMLSRHVAMDLRGDASLRLTGGTAEPMAAAPEFDCPAGGVGQ